MGESLLLGLVRLQSRVFGGGEAACTTRSSTDGGAESVPDGERHWEGAGEERTEWGFSML